MWGRARHPSSVRLRAATHIDRTSPDMLAPRTPRNHGGHATHLTRTFSLIHHLGRHNCTCRIESSRRNGTQARGHFTQRGSAAHPSCSQAQNALFILRPYAMRSFLCNVWVLIFSTSYSRHRQASKTVTVTIDKIEAHSRHRQASKKVPLSIVTVTSILR